MFRVALDAGHGINTPGKRTPADEREWSFNNKVIVAAIKYLKDYPSIEILRLDDPTGKTDVPLKTRTDKANKWKADILLSMHHNANTGRWGNWTGTETFTYLGSWDKSERLASIVQNNMVKAYGLRNRGLKKADFHMIRESKMPSILIEGGYMDSTVDIIKLRDTAILDAAGKAIADSVVEYFNLKKPGKTTAAKPTVSKPIEEDDTMFDTGSSTLNNALITRLEDWTDTKKYKNALGKDWLEKAKAGKLTNSQVLGLILEAGLRGFDR